MVMLVTDPSVQKRLIAQRRKTGADRWDEVWDGIYVMSPLPNNLHQILAFQLGVVFQSLVRPAEGIVANQVNVSDLDKGWKRNYRQPDVAVILAGGKAIDRETHYQEGPDLVVEILSPYDRARGKIPFYAGIGVRELVVVDRKPWSLELYRLVDGELRLVGRSEPDRPAALVSEVLPLSFGLKAGDPRPKIEIVHRAGEPRWQV